MAQNTESVVAKPLVFNGSLSSYPTWMRSLGLYMTFNSTKFPDDQSKVIYALSYMTEGTANIWAQAFYEEKMDFAGTLTVGTWAGLVIRLDATCKDANLQGRWQRPCSEREMCWTLTMGDLKSSLLNTSLCPGMQAWSPQMPPMMQSTSTT